MVAPTGGPLKGVMDAQATTDGLPKSPTGPWVSTADQMETAGNRWMKHR